MTLGVGSDGADMLRVRVGAMSREEGYRSHLIHTYVARARGAGLGHKGSV